MTFNLASSLVVLERTPQVLTALLSGLPEPWTSITEGPDTWSVRDVLGHLVHGEETDWIPRARIILESGVSRPFEPFDRFAQFERFRDWTVERLLERFAELREAGVSAVKSWELTTQDLDRCGTHPDFGTVTLGQLLATWVVHDLNHIAQITRVLARVNAGEVGPWSEYLSILAPRREPAVKFAE